MTSSVGDPSDNSEADEQQNHPEDQAYLPSPVTGMSPPGITTPSIQYLTPPLIGPGNAMGQAAYSYQDPYYRSIFAPYDALTYPAQPYTVQPMLMGIQQAGVPLPSDAVEEPVFVNAKQYHGILWRRQSCAKAELERKMLKSRKVCHYLFFVIGTILSQACIPHTPFLACFFSFSICLALLLTVAYLLIL